MNNKQNGNTIKAILNILLMTLLFTLVLGTFMPLLMGILSSDTPLGKFIKSQIRTIMFGTIIIFILLFIFVIYAFIRHKLDQTRDKNELKNKK